MTQQQQQLGSAVSGSGGSATRVWQLQEEAQQQMLRLRLMQHMADPIQSVVQQHQHQHHHQTPFSISTIPDRHDDVGPAATEMPASNATTVFGSKSNSFRNGMLVSQPGSYENLLQAPADVTMYARTSASTPLDSSMPQQDDMMLAASLAGSDKAMTSAEGGAGPTSLSRLQPQDMLMASLSPAGASPSLMLDSPPSFDAMMRSGSAFFGKLSFPELPQGSALVRLSFPENSSSLGSLGGLLGNQDSEVASAAARWPPAAPDLCVGPLQQPGGIAAELEGHAAAASSGRTSAPPHMASKFPGAAVDFAAACYLLPEAEENIAQIGTLRALSSYGKLS